MSRYAFKSSGTIKKYIYRNFELSVAYPTQFNEKNLFWFSNFVGNKEVKEQKQVMLLGKQPTMGVTAGHPQPSFLQALLSKKAGLHTTSQSKRLEKFLCDNNKLFVTKLTMTRNNHESI